MPDQPPSSPTAPPTEAAPLPTAIITARKPKRSLLPWLIPLIALAIAATLIIQSLASSGPRVTLRFDDGHGVKANDPVVHRGVQVGRIRSVGLDKSTHQIRIDVELSPEASFLKRFWIVRPELSLSHVAGLETLVGPRYIAADGGPRLPEMARYPRSLESPPTDSPIDGLHLTIRATRSGSLAPGSPVSYRELHVGEVSSVSLASDARTVEIEVSIAPEHAHLVRTNSRFWNVSGIGLDLGLIGGLKLKAESLQTIFAGGLAFATPDKPEPGESVTSGHEFELTPFDEDFLKWSPDLSANP